MRRIAVVMLTLAGLGLSPTRLRAQEALKKLNTASPAPSLFLTARVRRVARPPLDRDALRPEPEAAPWRLRLSTAPITALPSHRDWNRAHTALAGVFVVSLMIDAAQTRALARGGWSNFREGNPFLGERPSVGQINTYTALAGLGVLGAAAALPPRVRPLLLGAAIVVQAMTVARSARLGLPIRFF
jgi:hypothetical protein